jgi:MFS transporter, FHS family, L-fucose permease
MYLRRWCSYDVSHLCGHEISDSYTSRWPSGVYRSFGGFCAATFICGSGLGSLETAANPYLAVCGPPRYSEIRINFAQAFNGIGTVVAPALASYVFFKNTGDSTNALKNVQWVYLAVALFAFTLAILFFLSHIPEVTDADMELQVQTTHVAGTEKSFWKQYRLFHATFAQFCYVGAQGKTSLTPLISNCITDSTTPSRHRLLLHQLRRRDA